MGGFELDSRAGQTKHSVATAAIVLRSSKLVAQVLSCCGDGPRNSLPALA